jgi:hypothetical protein
MAVRYITYEWASVARDNNATPVALDAGRKYDIFTGDAGNGLTIPARANSTEFIVVEDLGISPSQGGSMQLSVGTTDYFVNPDGTTPEGIPAEAAPYPCGSASSNTSAAGGQLNAMAPSFKLDPPVYVLPGQKWSMVYSTSEGVSAGGGNEGGVVAASVSYTLYDGPDSLIANKLLEMGVPVSNTNVDWYKQQLLETAIQQEALL